MQNWILSWTVNKGNFKGGGGGEPKPNHILETVKEKQNDFEMPVKHIHRVWQTQKKAVQN